MTNHDIIALLELTGLLLGLAHIFFFQITTQYFLLTISGVIEGFMTNRFCLSQTQNKISILT